MSTRTTPRPVSKLLSAGGSHLNLLILRAERLNGLTETLWDRAGPPLNGHFQVANAEKGVLTLQADSSAWSSRLRFLAPSLLEHLQHHFPSEELHCVRVIVRPVHQEEGRPTARMRTLPAVTARVLEQLAEDTDHPGLRQALGRLAKRGGPPGVAD